MSKIDNAGPDLNSDTNASTDVSSGPDLTNTVLTGLRNGTYLYIR